MQLRPCSAQEAAAAVTANRAWLEECIIHLLCVLALDRFGDYVSDQVGSHPSACLILSVYLWQLSSNECHDALFFVHASTRRNLQWAGLRWTPHIHTLLAPILYMEKQYTVSEEIAISIRHRQIPYRHSENAKFSFKTPNFSQKNLPSNINQSREQLNGTS